MKTIFIILFGLLISFGCSSSTFGNEKHDSQVNQSLLGVIHTAGTPDMQELTNASDNELSGAAKKSRSQRNLFTLQKIMAMILALFICTGLIANVVVAIVTSRKSSPKFVNAIIPTAFNEDSVKVLKGLYFDKTHTWAFMDKNGGVKVGIDDFLQRVTGPITRIKMKEQGEKVKKGDMILSIIQKGKQLNVYSPVSGIITEQNIDLENDSSVLNSAPYTDGWVYKIEPSNWLRENQLLIMGENYKEWLKNEFSRLKDFLSEAVKSDSPESVQLVMQDGGELKDCILMFFGPEVWEDFQTNFIDSNI